MNVFESWLWSVSTGGSKPYMWTSSPAIFRENVYLVLAVFKHQIVLAVVLKDWYKFSSSKPLLEMFYFWSANDKRKRRIKRKKTCKLISSRRTLIFFSCKKSSGAWLVMKPWEVVLLRERDLFIIKREMGSPWSFLSAAWSKFLKNPQEKVARSLQSAFLA